MMEIFGIAVVSAVCGYVLDTLGFRGTRLYFAFVGAVMLIAAVEAAAPLLSEVMHFASAGGAAMEIGTAALRILGIGYIGGFFSDFCIQLGAKGASDGLLLFARIQMLAVVMPYFLDILNSAEELLG